MLTTSEEASAVGHQVCTRLDPLMTANGFLPGQTGFGADDVEVTCCSEYDSFRARFPYLAPTTDHPSVGACVDLNVSVALDGAPHLAEVTLEGEEVEDLLRDVGREDLVPQAATLAEAPLAVALERLHGLLAEAFGRATAPAAAQGVPAPANSNDAVGGHND